MGNGTGQPAYPWETGSGGTSSGTWSQPFEFPKGSGKYFSQNGATGEMKPLDVPKADLSGLSPLTNDPNYFISDPSVSPNASRFYDPYGTIFDEQRQQVPASEQSRLMKLFGGDLGGGSGADNTVGLANLALNQEKFAYEKEQDAKKSAFDNAMAVLKNLADEQQIADQRAAAEQQYKMQMTPYLVNAGQTHFSGFGPQDYGTKMGLVSPMEIQHAPFDPSLGQNPFDAPAASALEQLRTLGGLG